MIPASDRRPGSWGRAQRDPRTRRAASAADKAHRTREVGELPGHRPKHIPRNGPSGRRHSRARGRPDL